MDWFNYILDFPNSFSWQNGMKILWTRMGEENLCFHWPRQDKKIQYVISIDYCRFYVSFFKKIHNICESLENCLELLEYRLILVIYVKKSCFHFLIYQNEQKKNSLIFEVEVRGKLFILFIGFWFRCGFWATKLFKRWMFGLWYMGRTYMSTGKTGVWVRMGGVGSEHGEGDGCPLKSTARMSIFYLIFTF